MSRKDDIERRIRKIEKSEEKALKILAKQRKELHKALEENDKLISQKLNKGTPSELKLEEEIRKLTQRLETLQSDMDKIRTRREEQIQPLRQRSTELQDKLKHVQSQIDSTQSLRERGLLASSQSCGSRLDIQTLGGAHNCSSSSSNNPDPAASSASSNEYSPTSPPPAYSPYWKD